MRRGQQRASVPRSNLKPPARPRWMQAPRASAAGLRTDMVLRSRESSIASTARPKRRSWRGCQKNIPLNRNRRRRSTPSVPVTACFRSSSCPHRFSFHQIQVQMENLARPERQAWHIPRGLPNLSLVSRMCLQWIERNQTSPLPHSRNSRLSDYCLWLPGQSRLRSQC